MRVVLHTRVLDTQCQAELVYTDQKGKTYSRLAVKERPQCAKKEEAELLAILIGLERMRRPAEVCIVTESERVYYAIRNGWLQKWLQSNWINARGKKIQYADMWKQIGEMAEKKRLKLSSLLEKSEGE